MTSKISKTVKKFQKLSETCTIQSWPNEYLVGLEVYCFLRFFSKWTGTVFKKVMWEYTAKQRNNMAEEDIFFQGILYKKLDEGFEETRESKENN